MTIDPASIRFSLILPTLNEAARLPTILESVRRQRYRQDLIELLVADGGSTDDTIAIARRYGARVIHNPLRRAEPGAGILLEQATGDVAVLLAADNVFADEHFLEAMARPFRDQRIAAAFPALVNTAQDGSTARYFNAFTDPFNHFVYGGATSPASYRRTYREKRRTPDYVVYDFAAGPRPLIALAQGFAVRLPYRKPLGTDEDDIAPVEMLLAQGLEIAFVQNATLEHHTVRDIGDALRKFGPRFRARMTDSEQPVWQRFKVSTRGRRLRTYLWPFYSVSVIFPTLAAVVGAVRERRREWLYHPFVSAAFGFEFWRQAGIVAYERLRRTTARRAAPTASLDRSDQSVRDGDR
ncbi:MAG: glycosyltransferase [Candidatus Eremiobacteraeota bacterium]|nr:glycosyltransferase [Candidatus Eremiobacteraeota bacterium]